MFHKIKSVSPLSDYILSVQFSEGVTKHYDLKPLINSQPMFRAFKERMEIYYSAIVDTGGYGVIWDDNIDIACDELYYNGETVHTPFDGLIALSDATSLWGLNESTLRKAISYGKLVNGQDVCKFGKQWVISSEAMIREYGVPEEAEGDQQLQ